MINVASITWSWCDKVCYVLSLMLDISCVSLDALKLFLSAPF
jgi:hypothetical protein